MNRLVDRFAESARACQDLGGLRRLLEDAARDLGFRHFALLHHASLASATPMQLRIDNYPESWVDELVRCELAAWDPVHLASRRSGCAFAWRELGSIIPLVDRHRFILARSRHHGLGEGFTVPVNVPGEPSGSCSFAVRRGAELPRRRLLCTELIGGHAFHAARRIVMPRTQAARPHLSRREIQCLQLLARGKTDWEIARILGISVETARQYVKRARAAYAVASRTQLVVHGLRDEWVTFEEAIPPSGGMG